MFIIYLIFSVVSIVVFAILMVKILRDKISEHTISKIQTVVAIISAISTILFSILSYCSKPSTTNNLKIYNSKTVFSEEDTIKSQGTVTTDKKSESSETESNNITTTQNEKTESSQSSFITSTPMNNVKTFRELTTYHQEGSISYEDIVSDPRGNTYNDSYIFYGEYYSLNTGGGEYGTACLEKYLGGKFNNFTAVINPYKTFDKYSMGVKATVNVYADGNKVFSKVITRETQNESIGINVSGINYLKVELIPSTDMKNYHNQYSIILSNAILKE